MPKLDPTKVAPSQLYGTVKVDNNLSMGERIRKRFRPTDTVKVHNITSEAIEWQWLEEQDETYTIEDGSNIKIVEREMPGLWRLEAGELDVLPGACAYLMIEALYKQTCVLKTGIVLHPLDEREIKNFSFDDPQKQEEFIDLVYRGKVTPTMMQQAAMSQLGTFEPQVIERLQKLPTEKEEYERRTRSNPHATMAPVVSQVAPAPEHTELGDLATEFGQGNGSTASGQPQSGTVSQPIAPSAPAPEAPVTPEPPADDPEQAPNTSPETKPETDPKDAKPQSTGKPVTAGKPNDKSAKKEPVPAS